MIIDLKWRNTPRQSCLRALLLTLGILFAIKGGPVRAFYPLFRRDFSSLFGGLPHRTRLLPLLNTPQGWCDALLAQPSFFTVIETDPIEWRAQRAPTLREGRSDQPVGLIARIKDAFSSLSSSPGCSRKKAVSWLGGGTPPRPRTRTVTQEWILGS